MITAVGDDRDLGIILLGSQNVGKDRAELHLSEYTSVLYVGQDFFQIAHPCGKTLHFAQSAVYLAQLFADRCKRTAYLVVKRSLQLFSDHSAHFFKLIFRICIYVSELNRHFVTHILHIGGISLLNTLKPLLEL